MARSDLSMSSQFAQVIAKFPKENLDSRNANLFLLRKELRQKHSGHDEQISYISTSST